MDKLTFSWQSTPQLWMAYTDPEGANGVGKTRGEAVMDLLDTVDDVKFATGVLDQLAAADSIANDFSKIIEARDAEIARLTKALSDGVKDAARLDWLYQRGLENDVQWHEGGDMKTHLCLCKPIGTRDERHSGKDFRAAIDAAMEAPK